METKEIVVSAITTLIEKKPKGPEELLETFKDHPVMKLDGHDILDLTVGEVLEMAAHLHKNFPEDPTT